jgi:hypothetical protein
MSGSRLDFADDTGVNDVPDGGCRASLFQHVLIGSAGGFRCDLWCRKRSGRRQLLAVVIETSSTPVVLRGAGVAHEDVAGVVKRAGRDGLCAFEKQLWLLRGGRSRLEVVANVIQAIKFAIGSGLAPIVDHVVAEVSVDRSLKAWIAAVVVREEIVMPADPVAASDGGISVAVEVETLAQNAPLHGDPVRHLRGGQNFIGRPTKGEVVGDRVAGAFREVERVFAVAGGVTDVLVIATHVFIADANAKLSKNDVMRMDHNAVPAERDARNWRGGRIKREERMPDHEGGLECDSSTDTEDYDARATCIDCGTQATWA